MGQGGRPSEHRVLVRLNQRRYRRPQRLQKSGYTFGQQQPENGLEARDRKLPWPDVAPDHIRRSKADEEWDGAIAKWRALVEEAGVEHSNLARKISKIHKEPTHKLAL